MDCPGLVYPEPACCRRASKGRRFPSCNPTNQASQQTDRSQQCAKKKPGSKSLPGHRSKDCGKAAVLQLQVQEDAHHERKQRQCLHEHQTQ
jgi:hypothetical protein